MMSKSTRSRSIKGYWCRPESEAHREELSRSMREFWKSVKGAMKD